MRTRRPAIPTQHLYPNTASFGIFSVRKCTHTRQRLPFTFLPSTWNRMLPDKLTVAQLFNIFPAFYGNQGYVVVFRELCYLDPISNQINPFIFLTLLLSFQYYNLIYVSSSKSFLFITFIEILYALLSRMVHDSPIPCSLIR